MSIETAEGLRYSGGAEPDPLDMLPPSRGIVRQAWVDTISRPSARIGLTWLGLLAFFAAFAPFIANSHPILLKTDGHWSSPLLRHLTSADFLLLTATTTIIVLAIQRS